MKALLGNTNTCFIWKYYSMFYKIKVSDSSDITLEVKERKGELWFSIFKGVFSDRFVGIAKDSALAFNLEQAEGLNTIIQTIDAGKYDIREYGELQKGRKVFKIYINSFKGKNSLQIRERVESPTYTGYGKQGVSLPVDKIGELQEYLPILIKEFTTPAPEENTKAKDTKAKEKKQKNDNSEIEDYF